MLISKEKSSQLTQKIARFSQIFQDWQLVAPTKLIGGGGRRRQSRQIHFEFILSQAMYDDVMR